MAVFVWVFVAWTWRSKSPCCQLQLWCNRPRIRLDPTTGGMQATRQEYLLLTVHNVFLSMHEWKWFHRLAVHKKWLLQWQWWAEFMTKNRRIMSDTFNMTTKPVCQSRDEEQCYCIESEMVFGTHRHKCGGRRTPIIQSWQERQIRAYPKNVNLPVLGQGNLPLNRLQLLSSEERGRKREKDIWNQQLCGPLSTCCRLSDSLASLATELLHYTKTLTLFFPPSPSYSL